jgi:hypothetical protein
MYVIMYPSSGAALERGTATECLRRNGAFSRTKILRGCDFCECRDKRKYLHGER